MPARPPARSSLESDAEELFREVAHDAVDAARVGYRIARRVGRISLKWIEEASDRAIEELDKHRPRSR